MSRFAKDSLTSQHQQKENILALCWLGFLRHHCLISHPWATEWLLLLTVCLEYLVIFSLSTWLGLGETLHLTGWASPWDSCWHCKHTPILFSVLHHGVLDLVYETACAVGTSWLWSTAYTQGLCYLQHPPWCATRRRCWCLITKENPV